MASKKLLIITHAPSPNTVRLRDAVVAGARVPGIDDVEVVALSPFEADAQEVMAAQAVVLGTTENLGYMSGALKDFFDRIYCPCLGQTQGLPCALYVRAKLDGTGTRRAVESITGGLGWKLVQAPLICKGEWRDEFVDECLALGSAMAAGLDAGIF
jgi:multimeric flavodoxin WrbA